MASKTFPDGIGLVDEMDVGSSFLPSPGCPQGQERCYQSFSGRLDQLELYARRLPDDEVHSLFDLQNAWVDDRRADPVVVDADAPTARLAVEDGTYLPVTPTLLLAQTADPTTRVARVELGVDGASWTGAAEATDAEPGTAWMALFSPPGGGVFDLNVRAIDAVGNASETGPSVTVRVDDQPPAIGMSAAGNGNGPVRLARNTGADAQWLLPVMGSVSDPFIAGTNLPGSGVARLTITVLDERTGAPVPTEPHQSAPVVGGSFALDYVLHADDPTGVYRVRAVAVDNVGNRYDYELPYSVVVDNRAPEVHGIELDVPSQPGPVLLTGSEPGRDGGVAQAGPPAPPGWLDAASTVRGTVSERPRDASTPNDVAGVEGVDVAFEPRFSQGSPLINQPLPPAMRLYVPFEEGKPEPGSGGQTFSELVAGATAACEGTACPEPGPTGRTGGSRHFAGDDVVIVHTGLDRAGLTGEFTAGAWIRPDDLEGAGFIIANPDDGSGGFGFGRSGDKLVLTKWSVGDFAFREEHASRAGVLRPHVWQHVVVHRSASGEAQFWVNGRLVDSVSGVTESVGSPGQTLLIGANHINGPNLPLEAFRGGIDEAFVAEGDLTPPERNALLGLAPTLQLPLDEPSILPSQLLHDESGLGAVASYFTNYRDPADADHATVGVVGSGALLLTPGSHGLVVDGPAEALPGDDGPFTLALWIKDMGAGTLAYGNHSIEFGHTLLHHFGGEDISVPITDTAGWHHFAFVWDDATRTLGTYVDGARVRADEITGGSAIGADPSLLLTHEGTTDTYAVDDIRVYRRALVPEEVHALAATGWTAAAVDVGPGVDDEATWSAGPPAGIEGLFDLKSRGVDEFGNTYAEPQAAWSGLVDTLAPRIRQFDSVRTPDGIRHTLRIEDFSLDLDSLTLPAACRGVATSVNAESYGSPWYAALLATVAGVPDAAGQRPFAATVQCDTGTARDGDTFRMCDMAGNCASASYHGPNVGPDIPTPPATATATATARPPTHTPPPTSTERATSTPWTTPTASPIRPTPTRRATVTATATRQSGGPGKPPKWGAYDVYLPALAQGGR